MHQRDSVADMRQWPLPSRLIHSSTGNFPHGRGNRKGECSLSTIWSIFRFVGVDPDHIMSRMSDIKTAQREYEGWLTDTPTLRVPFEAKGDSVFLFAPHSSHSRLS